MKNILYVLILLLFITCKSQDKSIGDLYCEENVFVTYDESESDANIIELPKELKDNFNWVFIDIYLNSKDSIEIYFDNKHYITKEIKDEKTPITIFYKYNKRKLGVKLFLKSLVNKNCLEFLLNKNYNLVIIKKLRNRWELKYSGFYEINWK